MAQQRRIEGDPYFGTLLVRIRPKDADLAKELGDLPLSMEFSDVVRAALRAYLLGNSQAAAASYDPKPSISKTAPGGSPVVNIDKAVVNIGKMDTEGLVLEQKEAEISDDELAANIDEYLNNI